MQKQKGVSTLIGIIIIIIAIVIFFGGAFAYQYLIKTKEIKSGVQIFEKDENCNDKNNLNYDGGFGIEHTYEGYIKPGMYVKAVLSCDHQKLNISGIVSQIIQSSDLAKYNNGENVDLADLSGGEFVIDFDSDYNFDGYKDLTSIVSNGQGISAVDSYLIFLYDPKLKKFINQPDLSALENVYAEDSDKTIYQYFNLGYDSVLDNSAGFEKTIYKWNNNSLVKISKEECNIVESKSSKNSLFYRNTMTNFMNDGSKKVVSDQTKKLGDGSCLDSFISQ